MNDKPIEAAALNGQHEQQTGQSEQQEPVPSPVLPGKQLAKKRLELNWTIEEVANRLNLASRQIIAIESDNYIALPGMAITRGFIRSYAKLLNLESAPLLEMLPNETGHSPKEDGSIRRALPAKPFYASRSPFAFKRTGGTKSRAVLGLITLAIILISWKLEWIPESFSAALKAQLPFFASSSEDKDTVSGEASRTVLPTHADGNAVNVPAQAATTGKQGGSGANVRPSVEKDSETLKDKEVATSIPVKEEVKNQSLLTSNAPSAAGGKDMLVLKIHEESWIEVRDSSRKVLVSRLAKAGETESLAVTMPLNLKIGNAAGVEASLRGVPVELMSAAQGNVARLTVK